MIKCRDYQEYAVDSIFRYFEANSGNPVVGMPTGTGKSVVIAEFLSRVYKLYPNQRVIKLTHVKELIEQNYKKLLQLWGSAPAGIYSAGLKRKDLHHPIIFAGIASAINVVEAFGHVDLLLIDECHLVSPQQDTMYNAFIKQLKKVNPHLKVIGFTATHYRMKQGSLTEKGGIFTDICVDMTGREEFNWFIDSGYLTMLVPRPTHTKLNTENVSIQGGEFNLKELQAELDVDATNMAAIEETIHYAGDRKKWLIFATGIDHAVHLTDALNHFGVEATCVHSKLNDVEREARLNAHRRGDVQAIVNNGILTTGYDDPEIDLISAMRPTRSPGLWVQMLGRGTRPLYADGYNLETYEGRLAAISAGGKPNCLVLDFAGNTSSLGPINDPVVPKRRGKGGGPAPVKICEVCDTYCHAGVRVCPMCKFEFPINHTTIEGSASTTALIARSLDESPMIDDFPVDRVVYTKHIKADKPPSVKATYYCGLRRFDKYLCPEHGGNPTWEFEKWWKQHCLQNMPAPKSVFETLQLLNYLRQPRSVSVWHNKKRPEIMGYNYGE